MLPTLTTLKQHAYSAFAGVYDKLMADVDYDAWAGYLTQFLGSGKKNIVDCACGTGQISIRLARAGFIVTGVDISEDMLLAAGENARAKGAKVAFVRQDIAQLNLHKPVDAVVCACDGVNYLASKASVISFFESAYKSLKPGGMLLFDISSRYKLENILGCNTFGENLDDCAYIWKNTYDAESKLIEMELTIFKKRGGLFERSCERHVQRAHSRTELENWLSRAGFADIRVYEAFTVEEPSEEAMRLQFAAVKPN